MRVLYIDHTAKMGGGEVALVNLIRHVDRTLVTPIVLLFEDGPLADRLEKVSNISPHIRELDSSVAQTGKDTLGWRSVVKVRAIWLIFCHVIRVAHFAKHAQIDVIHTNSLKADVIGGLAGRLIGVPVVWHIRDRIDSDYLPKSIVTVFRLLSRLIPSYVIANSQATLATVRLKLSQRAKVIGSGVDLGTLGILKQVTNDPHMTRSPRVALVGRITPWKGQHIFIEAAAQVVRRHPEVRFQVIGAALFAEREYEESLYELCRELHIERYIEFMGFVDDVPARVSEIDILVHASITGEPFGQVIIEGMAAAKPVVATRGGGVPEIVVDGSTGILVPMGDAIQMAEAINYLVENPKVMIDMGVLGRKRVLDRFTIQHTCRMVERVYEEILELPSRPSTISSVHEFEGT